MNEAWFAEKFILDTLKADATLMGLVSNRAYLETVPEKDDPYPCILIANTDGQDTLAVGRGGRIRSVLTYAVRSVTREGSMVTADRIAHHIDRVLNGRRDATVTIEGDSCFIEGCDRMSPARHVEQEDGERYNYVGGLYEIYVVPLN